MDENLRMKKYETASSNILNTVKNELIKLAKKTTVEYTKIDFNQKLTEGFFSFQSLKKENP